MSEISLKDKIDELRNINDKLSSALESTENRIDKAIEYINEHIKNDEEYEAYCEMYKEDKEELLNILKGDK